MNKQAIIEIKEVQVQAQWTDAGRRFSQIDGYSQSGAIDWLHFRLANAILGNEIESPVIEVMYGQFTFTVDAQIYCCVSGAQATLTLQRNNTIKVMTINQAFEMLPGDVLHLDTMESGMFCYIAFAGEPALNRFRQSVCPVKREQSGGLNSDGNGLSKGDKTTIKRLRIPISKNKPCYTRVLNLNNAFEYIQGEQQKRIKTVPVCFTYQHALFSLYDKSLFLNQRYKVTQQLDRMGVRLKAQALSLGKKQLLSQPVAKGSVQISGDGMPIIMRNDRQTIGGYPILATVTSIGLLVMSQAKPNDEICFVDCDIEASQIQMQLMYQRIQKLSTKQQTMLLNDS